MTAYIIFERRGKSLKRVDLVTGKDPKTALQRYFSRSGLRGKSVDDYMVVAKDNAHLFHHSDRSTPMWDAGLNRDEW